MARSGETERKSGRDERGKIKGICCARRCEKGEKMAAETKLRASYNGGGPVWLRVKKKGEEEEGHAGPCVREMERVTGGAGAVREKGGVVRAEMGWRRGGGKWAGGAFGPK
uniref:Uncharacterized protein n=1 Tax=Phyllostachys edulis TaxID=38705 RepID=D3IVR3_PHYED|nr:hypothetical protein [Phyllostachys edulis]